MSTSIARLAGRIRHSRAARVAAIAPVLCGSMLLASCHSKVTDGRAASYLIINDLGGAKSGTTTFSNVLASDVVSSKGAVWEDIGRVSMTLAMKDITAPNAPSTNNWVTINRYHVAYRRSDGRNTQGVDVPYAFDGAINFTVTGSGGSATFTLVRVQAKLEAPLMALAGHGGNAIVISTLTDVTFYGYDQTGTEVSVTGTMGINFTDWADSTGS